LANNKQIHNVAIVGTGVIGASWAALLDGGKIRRLDLHFRGRIAELLPSLKSAQRVVGEVRRAAPEIACTQDCVWFRPRL